MTWWTWATMLAHLLPTGFEASAAEIDASVAKKESPGSR
jgi:hypothetical protein